MTWVVSCTTFKRKVSWTLAFTSLSCLQKQTTGLTLLLPCLPNYDVQLPKLQAKHTLLFLRHFCKLFSKCKGRKKEENKKIEASQTYKEFFINFQAWKQANIYMWVVRKMKYSREFEKSYLMSSWSSHVLTLLRKSDIFCPF